MGNWKITYKIINVQDPSPRQELPFRFFRFRRTLRCLQFLSGYASDISAHYKGLAYFEGKKKLFYN